MSQSASAKAKQILQRKEKDTRPGPPSQSTHDTRLSRQRATTPAGTREVFQTSYDEARQHLSKAGLLETSEPCNPQTMLPASLPHYGIGGPRPSERLNRTREASRWFSMTRFESCDS